MHFFYTIFKCKYILSRFYIISFAKKCLMEQRDPFIGKILFHLPNLKDIDQSLNVLNTLNIQSHYWQQSTFSKQVVMALSIKRK